MGSMSHKNVVNLLAICMNPFCIVMELVPCGSLYDFVHKYEHPMNWILRLKIARDLAEGVGYMHGVEAPSTALTPPRCRCQFIENLPFLQPLQGGDFL